MPRFLLSSVKEGWGQLTGEEARHVTKVHRFRVGDAIEVVGDHRVFRGVISEVRDASVMVRLDTELASSEPLLQVTLLQGLLKGDKFELIIQKAVELGVSRIIPVVCKRSVVALDEKKARERTLRWQRIAQEASKQSGRAVIPVVETPIPLHEALAQDNAKLKLMAFEGGGTSLKSCLTQLGNIQTVTCLIGPEGGFDSSEVEAAKNSNFKIVTLGPRILRAETAPLALLSILMYELGDIGGL